MSVSEHLQFLLFYNNIQLVLLNYFLVLFASSLYFTSPMDHLQSEAKVCPAHLLNGLRQHHMTTASLH